LGRHLNFVINIAAIIGPAVFPKKQGGNTKDISLPIRK
jgi:hypothetical protein